MAVLITTPNPHALFKAFMDGINKGTIETWSFHSDGVHFTHTSTQWARQAWFKASAEQGVLSFNIVRPKGKSITIDAYAEYHALLVRVFLAHFDQMFAAAMATALPASPDDVAEL